MDWEMTMRRQGVTEWRDRQILAAYSMFNSQAQEARAIFEKQLSEANLLDSVWDPAGFANARIDDLLRTRIGPCLEKLLSEAASELTALDSRFGDLGDALSRSEGIHLPEEGSLGEAQDPIAFLNTADNLNVETALPDVPGESGAGNWLTRSPVSASTRALKRGAKDLGERAAAMIEHAADAAERLIQDKAGLYNRLRAAAGQQIASKWMGEIGESRPVMAQVFALIDEVTLGARTCLL